MKRKTKLKKQKHVDKNKTYKIVQWELYEINGDFNVRIKKRRKKESHHDRKKNKKKVLSGIN